MPEDCRAYLQQHMKRTEEVTAEVKNVSRKLDRMLLLVQEGRTKDTSAHRIPCLPPGFQLPLEEQADLESLNCLLEEEDSRQKMVVYYAGTSHTSSMHLSSHSHLPFLVFC